MLIDNAIIVTIDFDGDIISRLDNRCFVFTGDNMLDEVKEIVKEALHDLDMHGQIRYNQHATISVYDTLYSANEVINDNDLLEKFIEQGGDCFGNWDIIISTTR